MSNSLRRMAKGDEVMAELLSRDVLYETRVFVRHRRRASAWRNWNSHLGGGPVLRIRTGLIEIDAPQGTLIETRHLVLSTETVSMKHDKIGLWGLPFGRRECIVLVGRDIHGWKRRIALSCGVLPELWEVLVDVGVSEDASR